MDRVVIFITYSCNYKCPYCHSWEKGNPGYRSSLPKDIEAKYWVEFLSQFKEGGVLDLTGGEPFLYPGIEEVVKAAPKGLAVNFTTNLSPPMSKIARVIWDPKVVGVTLSWHPSQGVDFDEFLSRAITVKRMGKDVHVNYVAYKGEGFDQVSNIPETAKRFEERGIPFHVDPYQGTRYLVTPEEAEFISKYTKGRRVGEVLKVPARKPCKAGCSYMVAEANGDVWRCSFYLFKKDKSIGYLGNIKEGSFKKLKAPSNCTEEYCNLGCDIDGTR